MELSERLEAGVEAADLAVVVAEHADDRAVQIGERQQSERRHEVAGVYDLRDLFGAKSLDRAAGVVDVVVGVGDDAEAGGVSFDRAHR